MQPKVILPGAYYDTEVSVATFKLSGASIAISSGVATVTLTAHLLNTGDFTTFSGVTGVTGLNNAVWGPITKIDANSYTFPTALTGSPAGTIVQEKLYFPKEGSWQTVLGANGIIEYNPDNLFGLNSAGGLKGNAGGDTWRQLVAAGAAGVFETDGFSVRFRQNGTTATSYFSRVA